ncbi:tetratricopeptide repeat domain-containing protein [Ditylenchus destructor]|nr:tetratricopeptide repeat domain-containing protein [Ditylenchus destructor]
MTALILPSPNPKLPPFLHSGSSKAMPPFRRFSTVNLVMMQDTGNITMRQHPKPPSKEFRSTKNFICCNFKSHASAKNCLDVPKYFRKYSMLVLNFDFLRTLISPNELLLILLCAVCYAPGWWAKDFVFDDREAILNNPVVTGKVHWSEVFRRDYWGRSIKSEYSHKSYRPITTMTFMLEYAIFGSKPHFFRATNVLLHALCTLVVYRFTKSLRIYRTDELKTNIRMLDKEFLTSAIFAIHPVHTEAVCNIVGRAEMMMTIFSILAINQYYKIREANSTHFGSTFLYVTLAAFAIFSKEQGIMIFVVCIATEFLFTEPKSIITKRIFFNFLCLSGFIWLRLWINDFTLPKFALQDNPAAFHSNTWTRTINYIYIWILNAWLLVNPSDLCFDYSSGCIPPIESIWDKRVFILAVAAIAMSLFTFYAIKRGLSRYHIFLLFFTVLTFLPSSNLLATVGFVIAERVLYFPSLPFIMLAMDVIEWLSTKSSSVLMRKENLAKEMSAFASISKISGMVMIALMATKTIERSDEWNSEMKLYASGLFVCPNNSKIHYNIGKIFSDQGNFDEARTNYINTLRLNPNHEQALNNLALILERNGNFGAAEVLLKKALDVTPNFATAWMNLGIVQMKRGKYLDSEQSFLKALEYRRPYVDCLFNMGNLYLKLNQSENAKECWRNTTRIDPRHIASWSNLFLLLEENSNCASVIEMGKEALFWNPKSATLYSQIGVCIAKLQKTGSNLAEKFLAKATQLEPKSATFWANLAIYYYREGRFNESNKAYKKSLDLEPTNNSLRENFKQLTRIY